MIWNLKARALLNFKVRNLTQSYLIQLSSDQVQASDEKVKQEHKHILKGKHKDKKLDSRQRQEENYWMNFRDTIYIQVSSDRQPQLSLSFKFSSSLKTGDKRSHMTVNLHLLYW